MLQKYFKLIFRIRELEFIKQNRQQKLKLLKMKALSKIIIH